VWDDAFRPDRGRVLGPADLDAITRYTRYWPADENHVAARTLPGVDPRGAFFTRGSGHNRFGAYTEIPDEYQDVVDRLARKHAAAAKFVPESIVQRQEGSTVGIITLGSCDSAVREAVELLGQRGVRADYLRVRGFPFDEKVESFCAGFETVFVIEQNRDAQLRTLLLVETGIPKDKLRSLLVYGGFPLSARSVVDFVARELGVPEPAQPSRPQEQEEAAS
jgi:2-oxoglutarate ferredoxin oxidoreductase subunit alpha